jgi:hypothetical protein
MIFQAVQQQSQGRFAPRINIPKANTSDNALNENKCFISFTSFGQIVLFSSNIKTWIKTPVSLAFT